MSKPFHSIEAKSSAPIFIFGDHASRHIPEAYNNLGLSGDDLTRHIAWDIGTDSIIRHLCREFGCAGHLAGVSRLVIDCNRSPDRLDMIPEESDGTVIPGNQNLTESERQHRINTIHKPYHAGLSAAIETAMSKLIDPLIVSIHSFTEKPLTGEQRYVDFGYLVKSDPDSAKAAIHEYATIGMNYDVRINEPYTAMILNHTVDAQVASRGLRHLNIEIRQDLITTDTQQAHIADILARVIGPVMRKRPVAPLP